MPHAEKNFSPHAYDSSIEPCLKKSKPDDSTSWARRDTAGPRERETQSQKWSFSGVSEDRSSQSSKGESGGPRVTKDFRNDSDVESFRNPSYQTPCNGRDYNTSNQQPSAETDKCRNNPDATFSETSTVFIGPRIQTPPAGKSAHGTRNNPKARSHSFKIKTVELRKTTSQSKGEDGMDYELRQFYKELDDLQADTDDHINHVNHTVVDNVPHFSPYPNKAPTAFPVHPHHRPAPTSLPYSPFPNHSSMLTPHNGHPRGAPISQPYSPFPNQSSAPPNCQPRGAPISQPYSPFPNQSSAPHNCQPRGAPISQPYSPFPNQSSAPHNCQPRGAPISQPYSPFPNQSSAPHNCHPREAPTSQVERLTLPLNNQVSCHSQTPFNTANTSSSLNHAIPPPGFEGHPPPVFIVPYGPPPPRYNSRLTFPRQNVILPPLYPQTDKYHSVNDNRPPWQGSHVPSESRTTSQEMGYTKPFPWGNVEKIQQERENICGQEDRHFGELTLPQAGSASPEQYPDRLRDNSACRNSKRKLVLLRGVPGSGKSTLACTLLDQSPDGIVFSTDDYFFQQTGYTYDVKLLGDAHSWNQNRAKQAMDDGRSPIIIDNTNIQGWEMKPYVQMAIDRGYDVEFLEPDTWWKLDPHELEKRNTHRVPREKISQMLERYECAMTVPVVMNSLEPRRVRSNRLPPEPRPRTPNLKKKRCHKKRQRKNGREIMNKKNNLLVSEDGERYDMEDPVLARSCKEAESDYDAANNMINVDGMGKVQVKTIYSILKCHFGKEGYLSRSLARCLTHGTNFSIAALCEILSRVMGNMNRPISASTLETPNAVTFNQSLSYSPLLSLVICSVLCKGMKSVRPFFRWHQEFQKYFHILDLACTERQSIVNASTDLCCSLIRWFAVQQSLHLYDLKCFKLQTTDCHKNQLAYRISDNQNVRNGKKQREYLECDRCNDCPQELDMRKCESVWIIDRTKPEIETKQKTGRAHVRCRNIYKLAPTFQQPRIFSSSQKSTQENSCVFEDGPNILRKEYENAHVEVSKLPMQIALEDNELNQIAGVACDGGRTNNTSLRAEEIDFKQNFYEDDLCAEAFGYSCGHNNPVLTDVQAVSPPKAMSFAKLCLPVQFARQLVELFGSPGVELDALEPEDLIVPLDHDLSRRIYLKWKQSLEIKFQIPLPKETESH